MSRSDLSFRPRHTGFTLVELLVVLGVIAILISLLMPALNRARQQAVMIDCQARMRTMGQAIHMYASQNRGILPASHPINAAWNQYMMPETLSVVLGARGTVDFVNGINPIFVDRDTISYTTTWFPQKNHYTFNARIFPDIPNLPDQWTAATNIPFRQITIAKVKKSSQLVAAWDGFQLPSWEGNAYINSMELVESNDGYIWWATKGFDSQRTDTPGLYDRPIVQTKVNRSGSVTFRHVKRTTANVLYLDGHVEAKKERDLRVGDFCFAWRSTTPVR